MTILTGLGEKDRFVQPLSVTEYERDAQYIRWHSDLPEIRHGQIWRIFTPMFLHFGFLHIFFNMLALFLFGIQLERRMGSTEFLLYYFFCGIGAGLATVAAAAMKPAWRPMSFTTETPLKTLRASVCALWITRSASATAVP